jgi:hypothetical protein
MNKYYELEKEEQELSDAVDELIDGESFQVEPLDNSSLIHQNV